MKRITRRWHRWHIGRFELNWFLGSGSSTVKWWEMRYRRHLGRTGFAIGPIFVSFWRTVSTDPVRGRLHRAGWWDARR